MCFNKQFEPILRFIAFFEGNLHFSNKVGPTARIICFMNIGAYACAGAEKLFREYIFSLFVAQILVESNDSYRKCSAFLADSL